LIYVLKNIINPAELLLSSSVATLRSSFISKFSNCVAVYPELDEGSQPIAIGSCTLINPFSFFSHRFHGFTRKFCLWKSV